MELNGPPGDFGLWGPAVEVILTAFTSPFPGLRLLQFHDPGSNSGCRTSTDDEVIIGREE